MSADDLRHLFYIVFEGTNERVVSREGKPLIVEEEWVDDTLESKGRYIGSKLMAMSLREYHMKYTVAERRSKHMAIRLADEEE